MGKVCILKGKITSPDKSITKKLCTLPYFKCASKTSVYTG